MKIENFETVKTLVRERQAKEHNLAILEKIQSEGINEVSFSDIDEKHFVSIPITDDSRFNANLLLIFMIENIKNEIVQLEKTIVEL